MTLISWEWPEYKNFGFRIFNFGFNQFRISDFGFTSDWGHAGEGGNRDIPEYPEENHDKKDDPGGVLPVQEIREQNPEKPVQKWACKMVNDKYTDGEQ